MRRVEQWRGNIHRRWRGRRLHQCEVNAADTGFGERKSTTEDRAGTRRIPAPRETYSKTRNTPHRENPEIPRRVIQDELSQCRRVRRKLPKTREAELREEEEASRRYQPPPPRSSQVDGHSTRVVSDSDASRGVREYLRQWDNAWKNPQGGRSSGECEDDRRFTNPAHVKKNAHHQEEVSRKEERRRGRKKSRATDIATAEDVALPRVVRRRRVATKIVPTAAEVTVTSRLGRPDIADGVPAGSGRVDERC